MFRVETLELERSLVPDLVVYLGSEADPAGLGERLDSRGDVHRVAEDIRSGTLDVTEMNPHPHRQGGLTIDGFRLVPATLKFHRALDRIQGVRELEEETVSKGLDLATPMRLHEGSNQYLLLAKHSKRARLILVGLGREPRKVGEHYRREATMSSHASPSTRD